MHAAYKLMLAADLYGEEKYGFEDFQSSQLLVLFLSYTEV
jgi:hypothetical protein